MNTFDRLDEVRDVARARAKEDFEYFANYVMGASLPVQYCKDVQRCLEKSVALPGMEALSTRQRSSASNTIAAWIVLLSNSNSFDALTFTPTETYTWLFGERRAA